MLQQQGPDNTAKQKMRDDHDQIEDMENRPNNERKKSAMTLLSVIITISNHLIQIIKES